MLDDFLKPRSYYAPTLARKQLRGLARAVSKALISRLGSTKMGRVGLKARG